MVNPRQTHLVVVEHDFARNTSTQWSPVVHVGERPQRSLFPKGFPQRVGFPLAFLGLEENLPDSQVQIWLLKSRMVKRMEENSTLGFVGWVKRMEENSTLGVATAYIFALDKYNNKKKSTCLAS